MVYIATFFSHFGAIRFKKLCERQNWQAKIMPVPRTLSSSCGTCVRFETDGDLSMPETSEEIEQIVQAAEDGYVPVYRAADC